MKSWIPRPGILLVSLLLMTGSLLMAQGQQRRPNILFILADQWRGQALGFLNDDPVLTPNLDRLAKEGVTISHALSNTPLCSPYRAMLMTGKTSLHNRITSNCWPDDVYEIGNSWRRTDLSLSDILTDQGFEAGYIGKLHLIAADTEAKEKGWIDYAKPEDRHGFNFWYVQSKRENGQFTNFYYVNDAGPDELLRVDKWASTHEADVIIDYLNDKEGRFRDSSKPFFLFWSPLPPHGPLSVPEEYLDRYRDKSREKLLRRKNVNLDMSFQNDIVAPRKYRDDPQLLTEDKVQKYFAMITALDHEIGRVLQSLKEAGLEENTIVVFTSDHGEMLGSHGHVGKYVWLDESIRVPFIIRWPGKIPNGERREMILNAYDIMPTLLGMAGLSARIPEDADGIDCSQRIMSGGGSVAEFGYYFKIGHSSPGEGRRGIRTLTHTYVVCLNDGGQAGILRYLYDDVNDPFQMNNLAGKNLAIEREMDSMLIRELNEDGDPFGRAYFEAVSVGRD